MSVHCHTCESEFLRDHDPTYTRICGCGIAACSHECLHKHGQENHLGVDGGINWPHGTACGACRISKPTNIVNQPRTLVSLCSAVISRTHPKIEVEEEKISSDDEEDLSPIRL